jgi:hypothetical protein
MQFSAQPDAFDVQPPDAGVHDVPDLFRPDSH